MSVFKADAVPLSHHTLERSGRDLNPQSAKSRDMPGFQPGAVPKLSHRFTRRQNDGCYYFEILSAIPDAA